MNNILNKPYLFFWGLIPLLLVLGFVKSDEVININIHDTYFIIVMFHFVIFLSFLLLILGFGYWIVLKLKKRLFKILSVLHVGFTFLGLFMILIIFVIPDIIMRSENALFDSLSTINVLLTLGSILIIFSQVFYPFNILLSLFRKK